MEIKLAPSLESFIRDLVKQGDYDTIDDAMNAAVFLLQDMEVHDPLNDLSPADVEHLRREIQIGIDESERGEVVEFDLEKFKEEARAKLEAKRTFVYTVRVEPAKHGGFDVTVPALPGCRAHGQTHERAIVDAREAIEEFLGELERKGEELPVEAAPTQRVEALIRVYAPPYPRPTSIYHDEK